MFLVLIRVFQRNRSNRVCVCVRVCVCKQYIEYTERDLFKEFAHEIMQAIKYKICRVGHERAMLQSKSEGHVLQNSLLLEIISLLYSGLQLIA